MGNIKTISDEFILLNIPNKGEIAVQTCYGIVGEFSKPPVEDNQFVLMDYRSNHLSKEEDYKLWQLTKKFESEE